MKKVFFALMLVAVLCMSVAFADVVDITMGSYNLLGVRIPFTVVMIITFFFVLMFAYIAIKYICNTEKTKATKIVFSVLVVILALGLFLIIPTVLPSPSYNHGMRAALPDSITINAYNSSYQLFEGVNRSPSEARKLIAQVKAHNSNNQERIEYGIISLIPENLDINDIKNTSKYDIKISEYNDMGVVKTIEIIEQ